MSNTGFVPFLLRSCFLEDFCVKIRRYTALNVLEKVVVFCGSLDLMKIQVLGTGSTTDNNTEKANIGREKKGLGVSPEQVLLPRTTLRD